MNAQAGPRQDISPGTNGSPIEVFRRIQYQWNGPLKSIRRDREYDNAQFQAFCAARLTPLNFVASDDNESNGLIDNANRTF